MKDYTKDIEQHTPLKRISHFRFYEELNDFLPRKYQKKLFPYEFIGKPSIKDTIEAIGVPHIEVDLILANDKSVGFDFQMHGGERFAVYPVFESLDISPLIHLRPKPLRKTKFVVDVNLGKLAPKLRLLGFDTLYKNNYSDNQIVEISLRDKRIILTRDKGILKYSSVTHGYWVRSKNPKIQLREVIKRLQLENNMHPFTRCSICNGLLQPVEKSKIQNDIPPKIIQQFDNFMQCNTCNKIYWKGSHCDRISEMVRQLKIN